ncbi:unnamed protein product [Closterium sp. Naga37s-1]|nr:unnamed protein product [Closterium sp. Naga37s-1]
MPRARVPAADGPDGAPRMVVVVVSAERRGQGAAQRGAGREMGDERSAEGGDARERGGGGENAARGTLAGDDATDGGAGGEGDEMGERREGGEGGEEAGKAKRSEMEGEARLLLSIERSMYGGGDGGHGVMHAHACTAPMRSESAGVTVWWEAVKAARESVAGLLHRTPTALIPLRPACPRAPAPSSPSVSSCHSLAQSSTYFAALLSSFREAAQPEQRIHWDPHLFAHLLPHLLPALPRPALSAPHIPGLLTSAVYFGVAAAVRAASRWAHTYCSTGGRGGEGLAGRSSAGAGGIAMRKGSGDVGRRGRRSGRRAGEGGCPWVCFPAPVSDVHWLAATWTAARDAGACCVQRLCAIVTAVEMVSAPHCAHTACHTNHHCHLSPAMCALTSSSFPSISLSLTRPMPSISRTWIVPSHCFLRSRPTLYPSAPLPSAPLPLAPLPGAHQPYLACEQRHCMSLLPGSLLHTVLATHRALLNVPRQAAAAPPPTSLPAPSALPFQITPCSCPPTYLHIPSSTSPHSFPRCPVNQSLLPLAFLRCKPSDSNPRPHLVINLSLPTFNLSPSLFHLVSSVLPPAHFRHPLPLPCCSHPAETHPASSEFQPTPHLHVHLPLVHTMRVGGTCSALTALRDAHATTCHVPQQIPFRPSVVPRASSPALPPACPIAPLGQLFQSLAAAATHHAHPSTRDDSSGASSSSSSSSSSSGSGKGRGEGGGSEGGRVHISPWTQACALAFNNHCALAFHKIAPSLTRPFASAHRVSLALLFHPCCTPLTPSIRPSTLPPMQVYSFSACCSLPPDAFLSSSPSLTHHAWSTPIAPCTLACPPLPPTASSTPSTQHLDPYLAPHTPPTAASQHLLPLPPAPLLAHLDISHCALLQPSHLRTWAASVPPPLSLHRFTARSCPALLPVPTLHDLSSFCPKLQSADFSLPEPPVFCRGVAGSGGGAAALPGAGASTGASVTDGDGDGKSKGGSKKAHKGASTASITGASGKKKQASPCTPSAVAPSGVKGRHGRSAGQGRRAAHQAGDRRVDGGGEEEQEEEEEEQEGEGSVEGRGEEGVGETASMLVPLHRLYNPWRLAHVTSLSLRWQQHLSDGQLMDLVLACPALTRMDITGCTSLSDRALAALISSYTRPPPAPASRTTPTVTSARQQKGGHSSGRSHCSERPSPRRSGRCIGELPRCRLQLSHLCASHTRLGVRSLLALSRALTAAGGAREGADDGDCGEAEEEEEEEEVKEVDEDESEDDEEEQEEDEEEGDGASEGHEEGDEEGVGEGRREDCGVSGTYGGLRKLELDGCPALHHALPLMHLLTAASPSLTHLSLANTLAPGRMGEPAAPKGKGRGREAQRGAGRGEERPGAVDDALVASWLHGARTLAAQAVSCTTSGSSSSSDGTAALPHLTHLNVSDAPLSAHSISALCTSAPRLRHLLISGCGKPTPPRPPSSSAPSSPPITTITIPPHLTTLQASWALPLSLSIPPRPLNPPTSPSSVCPSLPQPLPRLFPLSHSLRALALGLGATISDASLRAIAACCPRLTALSLTFQPVSDDGVLPLLAACPLRYLSLLHCWGPFSPSLFSPPLPTAQASLGTCTHHGHTHSHAHGHRPSELARAAILPRLTSLSLGGGFAWLSALHLTALASAAPLLRSLSLSSCPSLSQDAPLILASSFPALTSLTLTECPNLFSVHAPASLVALSALSSLHLRHTGKQAPSDFIQHAASRLPALQHLTLDLCDALSSSFHVPQEGRAEMHVMGDSLLVVRLFKCHVLHSSHAHSLTALTPSDSTSGKRTLGTKDVLVIARTTNGITTYVENVS